MKSILKLSLRWLLLGWAIPILVLALIIICVLNDPWTTDGTRVFYENDCDLEKAAEWCATQIFKFFTLPKP